MLLGNVTSNIQTYMDGKDGIHYHGIGIIVVTHRFKSLVTHDKGGNHYGYVKLHVP